MNSTFIPQVRGVGRFPRQSPSNGIFLNAASLTLDTDSELNEQSKLHFREKLMNNSTTRNIRNKTIDVPKV